MSYVLVALHDGQDEATKLTLEFAEYLSKQEKTEHFFAEKVPPAHQTVKEATESLQIPTGVFFGHCGRDEKTLRAQSESTPIWMDASTFGTTFSDARVYVFACETTPRPDKERTNDSDTFGEIAIKNGVKLFVGHYLPIGVPEAPPCWTPEQKELLQKATSAVFRAFLQGEGEEKKLIKAIVDAVDEGTSFEENLSIAMSFGRLRKSLVVLPR